MGLSRTPRKPLEPFFRIRRVQKHSRYSSQRSDTATLSARCRRRIVVFSPDRPGAKGAVRQSNRTDNDSAKMATGKGVIHGYTGVAAVDRTHQIIVEAQAHGTGSEQELLIPVVTAVKPRRSAPRLPSRTLARRAGRASPIGPTWTAREVVTQCATLR